jgi:phenylpropionate dioxygenase-like ring-hydroxylating dioxygenase large terminal subunit
MQDAQFVKNVWYMAAWSSEVGESLFRRQLLGRQIVLFRKRDGDIAALDDRCPHRFAPLSMGELKDDTLRCAYHGLQFNPEGACIYNPFADTIPRNAWVRPWYVTERDGIVWLWNGETATADDAAIPDFSAIAGAGTPLHGYMPMAANYEYGTDNLLDLSHIEFVHKGSFAGNGVIFAGKHEVIETDEVIHSNWWMPGVLAPPHTQGVFPPDLITDHWLEMRWQAPANMYLQIGATPAGTSRGEGCVVHQAHILTPATEGTTHYFWASSRATEHVDPAMDEFVKGLLQQAFNEEDKPIIEAAFANLDGEQFRDQPPVSLGVDAAGIRARRKILAMLGAST